MTPTRAAWWLLLAALAGWQLLAIAWVDVDYFDAYETLINARYFLGEAPSYIPSRWPLMAWLIVPAEALREALGLHPLDLRLLHAVSGALHVGCIVAVYALLTRRFGDGAPTLLAFVAAIPTYLYFTSAPFLSHDIAPGGVLLWMLFLADDFLARPSRRGWVLLALAGSAAALIKPTYALFWVALLVAFATLRAFDSVGGNGDTNTNGEGDGDEQPIRSAPRGLLGLATSAIVSALLFWLASAFALAASGVDVAWWREPYEQILHLVAMQEGDQPPWWVYLRNLPANGVWVPLLILPGVALAFRGNRLDRAAAIVWLLCAVAMQAFEHREVRYLGFLAPLSAFLLVRPLRWILDRRALTLVACAVLGLSWLPFMPYSPLSAADRIGAPFYRNSELRQLLAPLGHGEGRHQPVVLLAPGLSFTPPDASSPLVGDPFHMIFHFFPHQLGLLGYEQGELLGGSPERLEDLSLLPANAAVVYGSGPLLRTYRAWPPPGRDRVEQWVGTVRDHELVARASGGYATASGEEVRLLPAHREPFTVRLEGAGLASLAEDARVMWLMLPPSTPARARPAAYRLEGDPTGGYRALGLQEVPRRADAGRVRIRSLVVAPNG